VAVRVVRRPFAAVRAARRPFVAVGVTAAEARVAAADPWVAVAEARVVAVVAVAVAAGVVAAAGVAAVARAGSDANGHQWRPPELAASSVIRGIQSMQLVVSKAAIYPS
jgi:hypothetical protein